MKRENGNSAEKEHIIQLLGITEGSHEAILEQYRQKQALLYARLKEAEDIKERIKLQNILLELDDTFLDYQSSIHHKK